MRTIMEHKEFATGSKVRPHATVRWACLGDGPGTNVVKVNGPLVRDEVYRGTSDDGALAAYLAAIRRLATGGI